MLGLLYLRKSDKVFDPLAAKAIEKYAGHSERAAHAATATSAPEPPPRRTEVER